MPKKYLDKAQEATTELARTTRNIGQKAVDAYQHSSCLAKTAGCAGFAAVVAKLNQSEQCSQEFTSTFFTVAAIVATASAVAPSVHKRYQAWQQSRPRAEAIEMSEVGAAKPKK